jgi:hypothetical protein
MVSVFAKAIRFKVSLPIHPLTCTIVLPRGRCYDHNFQRFLPIFGKKLAFFSKTNVMIKFLQKLAVCSLSKKRQSGIMAQAFALPQPGRFMHGEITTSSRLSLTLLNNMNQKGFQTNCPSQVHTHLRIQSHCKRQICMYVRRHTVSCAFMIMHT